MGTNIKRIQVCVCKKQESKCPKCGQKLFNRVVPKYKTKGLFCNICNTYYVNGLDSKSKVDAICNKGKAGYCIKCGEKVYKKEMYCFECFKQQRSE